MDFSSKESPRNVYQPQPNPNPNFVPILTTEPGEGSLSLSLYVFFLVLATIVSSSILHGPSQFGTAVMSIMSGVDAEIGAAAASDSLAPEILPETNIGFKVK